MIIDLSRYATEVGYWFGGYEQLFDQASKAELSNLSKELGSGQSRNSFGWSTKGHLKTEVSKRYDRAEGEMPPIYLKCRFQMQFAKLPKEGRKRVPQLWRVAEATTRIRVYEHEDGEREEKDRELLTFHFDLKARDQLGPCAHVQVAEDNLERLVRPKLAVPRLPSAVLLPTDCLDLVLTEFLPDRWGKVQSNLHNIGHLKDAQERQARSFKEQIEQGWKNEKPRRTPVSWLQNVWLPSLQLT